MAGLLKENESYYTDAKSWYQENYESIICSRNRYRLFALINSILLGLSIIAIIIMMPLKQYVYRIIEVNKQTGEIAELREMEGHTFTTNWVINRYFINQYVQLRESYHLSDIKRCFNIVAALSSSPIAKEYVFNTLDSNPKSPINLFKDNFYRDVKVLGINQLNENTAMARYQTITHNKNELNEIKTEDWQVILKWEYTNPSESLEERDKNPLGFKITYYQNSPIFSDK
ncbi:MAG: type IV secretion system protein [Gammaproteobacteria bacterium]|nr:type IV secretion system protein [Gammaproteobacteria bacterium]